MDAAKKPIIVWIFMALLLFLSLGGFYGGIAFLTDPSGVSMGLDPDLLEIAPVDSYILPGLFLTVVMGIFPLVVIFGLWKRTSWAWKTAVAFSVILIGWILFQILLWGTPAAIQLFYLLYGFVLLGLCFVPALREYATNS